jgi:hypothetical protein
MRLIKAKLARGYILYRYEQSNRQLHSEGKLDESDEQQHIFPINTAIGRAMDNSGHNRLDEALAR